jgi:hypothetical protein
MASVTARIHMRVPFYHINKITDIFLLQKFKGLFKGPLVLQTFGAHFTAAAGAQKLLGGDDPENPAGKPIGGLGLAAAGVSTLVNPYGAS